MPGMRTLAWLMVVVVCACARHNPTPDRWTLIVESPITAYYVSTGEIERSASTTLSLPVKTVYKPGNAMHTLGVGGAVNEIEYDCTRRQVRVLALTTYDRHGHSGRMHVLPDPTWLAPRHGSDAEVVMTEVCTRFAKGP